MKYDNIIFDMDGTLLDTYRGVSRCINFALMKIGKAPLEDVILRKFLGPALYDSFLKYIDIATKDIDKVIKIYRDEYLSGGIYECELYDGFPKLLYDLKEVGYKLSIASAKPHSSVNQLLKHFNIYELFDKVVGAEPSVKDSSKTELVRSAIIGNNPLMIGDRIFDIEAARTVGIDSVAALYGYSSLNEFENCMPTYFVKSVSEILQICNSKE